MADNIDSETRGDILPAVKTPDGKPDETMASPAERRETAIFKRVANGDTKAILEAFPRAYRPEVTEELLHYGRLLDVLGPGDDHNILLHEAQTSAAFPYLLGAQLHKELMAGYAQVPPVWQAFCETQSLGDFKLHYGIRPSELEALEEVPEGAEYTEATFSEVRWNYKCKKYGKTFSLTWEAQKNDDLGEFVNVTRKMGQAAQRLLNKTATKQITANAATTYDSVTLLHASSHGANLVTNVLNEAYLETGIGVMGVQVDSKSNPLAITPAKLMVVPQLLTTAQRLTRSAFLAWGADDETLKATQNVIADLGIQIVNNPWLFALTGTATPWLLLANPAVYPCIRVGFLEGRQEPELFRSQPGNPLEFTRDVNSWKIRFCFGIVSVDHVGIYGRIT